MLKRTGYFLFLLGFTVLIVESLAYGTGLILQKKGYLYKEPYATSNFTTNSYDEYLSKRDKILGWPYPSQFGGSNFDITGSRRIPAFEDPTQHQSCVSLYGDSFTKGGGGVDHEHAWSNVLSQRLNCRVANFGMGGYGTDQAYLRFKHNHKDEANVVVLGHLSENILRNLTRNRDLLTFSTWYALKPRFILDDQGNLKLVPIPQLSEKAYRQLMGLESPQLELAYENFYPGGPAGVTELRFPYTYAILKNMNYYRLRAKFVGRPGYAEFYIKGHPFGGLEITTEIIKSFFFDAKQRSKDPVIIIFATGADLRFYQKNRKWTYHNLMEALDAVHIPYLNFGQHLLEYMGKRDLGEIFTTDGHYNEEGNQVVADFVYAHIKPLVLKQTNKQEQ
jgi:lysophospholipase L1-like esterase